MVRGVSTGRLVFAKPVSLGNGSWLSQDDDAAGVQQTKKTPRGPGRFRNLEVASVIQAAAYRALDHLCALRAGADRNLRGFFASGISRTRST